MMEGVYEFPVTPQLSVSFQRYRYPTAGTVDELPASLGALPVHPGAAGEILLPSPAGEAFWLGFLPESGICAVAVLAVTAAGERLDAATGRPAGPGDAVRLQTPPRRQLAGISRHDGGWWAFARTAPAPGAPACERLELLAGPAAGVVHVAVRLVDEQQFRAAGGVPVPPLDPDAGYQGWRLP